MHGGKDEHGELEHDPARLEKESEGKARGEAHPGQALASAPGIVFPGEETVSPRLQPRQIDEAGSPAADEDLQGDGVGGEPALAIGEHGAEEAGVPA
jgi:hypothetical protein